MYLRLVLTMSVNWDHRVNRFNRSEEWDMAGYKERIDPLIFQDEGRGCAGEREEAEKPRA